MQLLFVCAPNIVCRQIFISVSHISSKATWIAEWPIFAVLSKVAKIAQKASSA
jgi:hypothetical protein